MSYDETTLIQYIQQSPLVNAAITEAVHKYYHDRVLSPIQYERDLLKKQEVSNILSTLWNLNPNWRLTIKQYADKYKPAFTNTLPADGRPNIIVPFSIEILLNDFVPTIGQYKWTNPI